MSGMPAIHMLTVLRCGCLLALSPGSLCAFIVYDNLWIPITKGGGGAKVITLLVVYYIIIQTVLKGQPAILLPISAPSSFPHYYFTLLHHIYLQQLSNIASAPSCTTLCCSNTWLALLQSSGKCTAANTVFITICWYSSYDIILCVWQQCSGRLLHVAPMKPCQHSRRSGLWIQSLGYRTDRCLAEKISGMNTMYTYPLDCE